MRPSIVLLLFVLLAGADPTTAQIRVDPTGVNVDGHGATSVLLTFGGLDGYRAAEAQWCGETMPATPDLGLRCDPTTLFGFLPARFALGRPSGIGAFTDIMSVPASVARRAYEAAEAGQPAAFFYVRRFVASDGRPDQYVRVTCRLTAGGAGVPLSLTDVRLAFDVETPVLAARAGETLPQLSAAITYTGTGRLRGRWEVVLPGQDLPSAEDLLTEASLPVELRGTQRRYTEIERFNLFLSPVGRATLPGPPPARLPTGVEGQYVVLFRVEASDEAFGDSNLANVGAGPGVAHNGAVAGFPMPVLRYVIGAATASLSPRDAGTLDADGLAPIDGAIVSAGAPPVLRWSPAAQSPVTRIEFGADGDVVFDAVVTAGVAEYAVPPFVLAKAVNGELRWRVVAIDGAGGRAATTAWRRLIVRGPGQ
jgi:hypothetical protein